MNFLAPLTSPPNPASQGVHGFISYVISLPSLSPARISWVRVLVHSCIQHLGYSARSRSNTHSPFLHREHSLRGKLDAESTTVTNVKYTRSVKRITGWCGLAEPSAKPIWSQTAQGVTVTPPPAAWADVQAEGLGRREDVSGRKTHVQSPGDEGTRAMPFSLGPIVGTRSRQQDAEFGC